MHITERIHALKIPFKINLPGGGTAERFVYSYVIFGEKIYLIDSGVAGAEERIFGYIEEQGRSISEISLLILTHSHPDHIGSAAVIKERTGCLIAAHSEEQDWIEDTELQAKQRPVPGFNSLVKGPVKVDRLLNDRNEIWLEGGLDLQVLHTPGHSRGSISLLMPEEQALFSGDSIFIPGDMPIYEDVGAAVQSINKLKNISGIEILLSSWDDPRRDAQVYKTMDRGLEYLARIQEAVRKSTREKEIQDPMQLCREVVAELGLGPVAVNPLTARSFQANVRALLTE